MMKTKLMLALPLIGALAACGGGGDGVTTDSAGEGTVSVLITDNLTQDYTEVWVKVQAIRTRDTNGQPVTLYEDASGQTHNLSQLVNVGALVDAQALPAGNYSGFEIVLANEITLVDHNGVVTQASFTQNGAAQVSIEVSGNLTVAADQSTALALDFDLQQFSYDPTTNTVTPVIVQKDPNTLQQSLSTSYGEVEVVLSDSAFILDPEGNGRDLTVVLHPNASVTDTATGEVRTDTRNLRPDLRVSVSGSYDAASLTLTAATVQIENGAINVRHEIEGTIEAVNGSSVHIDIIEASFMPASNSITVDLANAAFSHGALSQLDAGQRVEIKGHWDGSSFTAAVVEIEGYSRNGRDEAAGYVDEYGELEGEILSVSDVQLSVRVREYEHMTGINIGDTVTIDSRDSWIKHGSSACLVAGALIEAKGPMSATDTMTANLIEIEGSCISGDDVAGDDDDRDADTDDHDRDHEHDSDDSDDSDDEHEDDDAQDDDEGTEALS